MTKECKIVCDKNSHDTMDISNKKLIPKPMALKIPGKLLKDSMHG